MKMNKKGAEGVSMTGVIIGIILLLVVLVVLIYFFSTGSGNLWQKILGYGGGKVNVQSIVDSCKIACTTSATYDYCTKERDIIFTANGAVEKKKCKDLEGAMYGLDACPSINCAAATPPAPPATGAADAGATTPPATPA